MIRIIKLFLITIILNGCATLNPFIPTPALPPKPEPIKHVDVALVLGGGGSKAIAHVGALSVLTDNLIPIDMIVGTSAGSAIGAMYADNPNPELIRQKMIKLNKWEILDPSFVDSAQMLTALKGPIRGELFEKYLYENIEAKLIEQLKIPLVIVTVDILNNEVYLIRSGPIAPAIHASSAIPPIFTPVNLYGRTLVDGGVLHPVPVKIAKQFNPKLIIAIDIGTKAPKEPLRNMIDLTYRSIWLYYYELSRMQSALADIDIHPILDGHGTFEDHKKEDLYNEGKKAALAALPKIRHKLRELGIPLLQKTYKSGPPWTTTHR